MVTRRRALGIVGLLSGIVLLAVGAVLLTVKPASAPKPPVARNPAPIITPVFPSADTSLTGYRITSHDLGIDLPLVEGDGWTVPFFKAAHYPGMKLPGQNGRSLIYAHAQAGMFAPLYHAHPGQDVEIIRKGLPTLHYVIKRYFPKWSPSDLTYTRAGDHEELVLLTCTTYDANDPRIIAVAEPA